MVAGRSIDHDTSSAVISLPSWNFTPLRSLNSQVRLFTSVQDSARPGITRLSASIVTSVSNTWSETFRFGNRL